MHAVTDRCILRGAKNTEPSTIFSPPPTSCMVLWATLPACTKETCACDRVTSMDHLHQPINVNMVYIFLVLPCTFRDGHARVQCMGSSLE